MVYRILMGKLSRKIKSRDGKYISGCSIRADDLYWFQNISILRFFFSPYAIHNIV